MEEKPTKEHLYDSRGSESTDYRALFFKYFSYWPAFLITVVVFLITAKVYLFFATPTYNVHASVLFKDEDKGNGRSTSSALEGLGLDGLISTTQNFDNEVEMLHSVSLITNVINELSLNITYKDVDKTPAQELYKSSPVQVTLTPQEAEKLDAPAELELILYKKGTMDVNIKCGELKFNKQFSTLPAVFPTKIGTFVFRQTPDSILNKYLAYNSKDERHIKVIIAPPSVTANGYFGNLSVVPSSKQTTIAKVVLKTSNKLRGKDFINGLIAKYNYNNNEDKNLTAEQTAEFIDSRIAIINKELGSTEEKMQTFKQNSRLTDLTSDAQITLTSSSEYEKKISENETQISLVRDLIQYIENPSHRFQPLPNGIGLADDALTSQIDKYNELVTERKRLLNTSTENNPTIINIEQSIDPSRKNVETMMKGSLQSLFITKKHLEQAAGVYGNRISAAPGQEREYLSISRQQEIKSNLYLLLLQKREENAMTLAATTDNAKIIDETAADPFPVSPKGKIIYLMALIVGVGLVVAIIYIIDLMRYKIETREDLEKLTKIPIVGEIPQAKEVQHSIAVKENVNDVMSETFRYLRTNLLFILKGSKKVIMFTSTMTGEGKTFMAANLAISFSLLGKKVIIVGLDIRKPGLNKVFNISHKELGLTQYLAGVEADLMSLVRPTTINKNLFILPGGVVPPNPTELLTGDELENAISILKEKFDYIILDTAPIGMVTDTQVISRVAEVSVYVCRANYTPKADYIYINELNDQKKLPGLCTVINGLDMESKRYGYSRYGYGHYKYGYDYGTNETK